MTGYEVRSYEKYEQEEQEKLERELERVVRDYNRKNIFISVDFLRRLKSIDSFVYDKFMKREDIPLEVVNWFWHLCKQ